MLAALAGRLSRLIPAIGGEPFVPAYEAERAVCGERAVQERERERAGGLGEDEPAIGVVESVDREACAGEQLRRVGRREPHAEGLGLRAVEVRQLQPHGL